MNIYRCLWKLVQDQSAQMCTDFHRIDRIRFFCSSGINLKSPGKSRIAIFHIADYIFSHLLQALILINHNRTDSHNAKYTLKRFYRLIKIIFFRTKHIYSSLFFDHTEISIYRFQRQTHLFYQGILKKIPVLSFDGNFRIFDQKCMKNHIFSPLCFLILSF